MPNAITSATTASGPGPNATRPRRVSGTTRSANRVVRRGAACLPGTGTSGGSHGSDGAGAGTTLRSRATGVTRVWSLHHSPPAAGATGSSRVAASSAESWASRRATASWCSELVRRDRMPRRYEDRPTPGSDGEPACGEPTAGAFVVDNSRAGLEPRRDTDGDHARPHVGAQDGTQLAAPELPLAEDVRQPLRQPLGERPARSGLARWATQTSTEASPAASMASSSSRARALAEVRTLSSDPTDPVLDLAAAA